jgi:hypothetical protein
VVLERIDSHIAVSVIDTGEGIAPGSCLMSSAVSQGDASTSRRHSGLGPDWLSSSACRAAWWLRPGKAVGWQGTSFTVHLPSPLF